jgi:hypothetical protein
MLWQVVEDQNQEEELNMAFKFKVKKRPNMAEAVASAFAAGAIQGGTTALQNAMKEREDRKNNSTKELNSFNSVIAGLPSTPENLSKIIPIKADIATGKITARNGLDILGYDLDYQTTQQKQAEIKLRQEEGSNLSSDPRVATLERKVKQSSGMFGLPPTKAIEDVRKIETEIRKGVKTDPMQVKPNTIALMKKREIDISRNAVKDITKVIKDLEEKKQNAIALEGSDFAIPFTSQDQERLDSARAALPEWQQKLNNALNPDSVTNVQNINQEIDEFAEFLEQ